MSDKKKQILSRLMALNNPKADKYLAKFARDIFAGIKKSRDNESILKDLDLLGEFVYKVPKETIEIVIYIVEQKANPATIHKSPFGEFEGKSHKDLVLKSIELLGHIRYIAHKEMLKLIAGLSLYEDSVVKNKALDVVKRFSQYDYNVLTKSKIGYGAQREALDFLLAWSREEQLRHIDFVETVLREILNASVEGTTSGLNEEAQYTITMHSGVVSPTDFLKKMRQEAIGLTYELYKVTDDANLKLKLVKILDETTRTPSNVVYGEDIERMIVDDLKYLTGVYQEIVFGKTGDEMIDHLGIVEAIEQRLYWINKSGNWRTRESKKLREDILKNDLYHLFRLLVGDSITYREEEEWNTAEAKRNEEINQLISSIEVAQIKGWGERLNKIANQHILIEDWKFNTFKGFVRKLSETKPEIADNFLEISLKDDSSLKHFIGSFLDGFRMGTHFKYWDKYVNKIVDTENIELINALIFSLNIYGEIDLEKYIRSSDLDLLEKIVKQQEKFSFLKKTDNLTLHYALINTLARNYKRAPKLIESLVVEEIRNNPKYLDMFFQQLSSVFHRGWMSIRELQPETIELLKDVIVGLSDIDWHIQEILLAIGENQGLSVVLNIFMERIQKDATKKEKMMRRREERYDPIPYHFNPDLSKFIVEHSDYERIATEWLIKMTTDWSTYNWHVSHFLERVGKGFDEILGSFIQKGDDDSLMKAARAMHSIEGTNFDLCIEIVRRTDNKRISSQVDSNMYTTGVVSGEYGLAEAYEAKAKALEIYKTDESKRVKKFAERMTKSFLDSAKRERQHADEEKQLRKTEFES